MFGISGRHAIIFEEVDFKRKMHRYRYDPPRDKFTEYCQKENCWQDVVVCTAIRNDGKVCGVHGHPDFYKYGEDDIAPYVEHGHFLSNKDVGRNCFHRVGEPKKAPENMKRYTWRTPRPRERWANAPQEVKKEMGWY